MDHLKLLCDFGELDWVLIDRKDIRVFLERLVDLVRRHMGADACTIYLHDPATDELELEAGDGVEGVGRIRLKLGEGLSGVALKELRPIRVSDARRHPAFRYVEGLDRYESYLSMPIARGLERIGVLTLQRGRGRQFDTADEQALQVIAGQLANIIASTRAAALRPAAARASAPAFGGREPLRGLAASEGWAVGPSLVYDRDFNLGRLSSSDLPQVSSEVFREALERTGSQLERLQEQVGRILDDAASKIFTSHLLILNDPMFLAEIQALIDGGESPAAALLAVARKYMEIFARSPNPYVQEKVADIKDIVIRIVGNLRAPRAADADPLAGRIVVARELLPSDILQLSSAKAAGIVQVSGGVTSHVSLLVRSLRIPLVITDRSELLGVPDGTPLFLDGDAGNVYVDPALEVAAALRARQEAERRSLSRSIRPESHTADGTRIRLLTNINLFSDMRLAVRMGAEGVGLYRTEFPFLIRDGLPTEEEQHVIYRRVVEAAGGREVVFRTLDVGGDKALAHEPGREANPFLGLRSIRFSLAHPDVFRAQVRAILRACAPAPAKLMFPMVSSPDELASVCGLVEECAAALQAPRPILGAMVELPSVVEIVGELAQRADFFSIGTNDFVQYMLGVDRANERVADFYLPHHPAVLRALRRVAASVLAAGKELSVCGEMAHQRPYLAFLVGIGIRVFSMDAGFLPEVQEFLAGITLQECGGYARSLLQAGSVEEAGRRLRYT